MISIINSSYRRGGLGDKITEIVVSECRNSGLEYTEIVLRNRQIEFCTNCRGCMKQEGTALGTCYLEDDCAFIFRTLDSSERVILISPINFFDLPAIFRKLLERAACFGFWPSDARGPKFRRVVTNSKRAFLITTSAMPSLLVPLATSARKTFRHFCKTIGFSVSGYYNLGGKGRKEDLILTESEVKKLQRIIKPIFGGSRI